MAIFGLCNCRIQKWRFFNFPGPPRGFFQKNGQKWPKNDPFFTPFWAKRYRDFRDLAQKVRAKTGPLIDLKEVGPRGRQIPDCFPPSIPNKIAQIGLQNGLKWLKMSELVLFLVESG